MALFYLHSTCLIFFFIDFKRSEKERWGSWCLHGSLRLHWPNFNESLGLMLTYAKIVLCS